MEESITSPDVREESIPQTLTFRSSLDQSSNVHNVQESWYFAVVRKNEKKGGERFKWKMFWGLKKCFFLIHPLCYYVLITEGREKCVLKTITIWETRAKFEREKVVEGERKRQEKN